MTRIFYAADIHGSELCFRKFINAARFYNAQVLILGGDLTGKMIVPIVGDGCGEYSTVVLGKAETASNLAELAALEERIRGNGFYPHVCSGEEHRKIAGSSERRSELFRTLILETLERWVQLAEKRLDKAQVRCFIMLGNDDDPIAAKALERGGIVVNPEFRSIELPGDWEMLSIGYSNKTPFDSPREISEEALGAKIAEQVEGIDDPRRAIFNFHCPPFDSGLDSAPELDERLAVQSYAGQPRPVPVGSTAVRDAIIKYQPLLGLHGHVHESRGGAKLGRTLCLNPGSSYGAGILQGVIIELDESGVRSHQFVSG